VSRKGAKAQFHRDFFLRPRTYKSVFIFEICKVLMHMAVEQKSLSEYVVSLLDNGQGREEIEGLLREKGHEDRFVKELVKEAINLRNTRRQSQGMTLVLTGAVICFSSFLLTVTSSFTHSSFPMVLYGLTSVGIIVAFAGLTKVF
jgi:hypothetical protein